tara:strand:- start:231 stop:773 length:543 start_codon:yes stop_codon:yes gene_type:complete
MGDIQSLKSFNNSDYNPGSSIKIAFWNIFLEFFFNTFIPYPSYLKCLILKIFGAKIGNRVIIKPRVRIKYPWLLSIGNDVWIGESVWIDNLDNVIIEENVCLSQGAVIMCGAHDYKKPTFNLITRPIKIESESWICTKSIVLQGVTCKKGSILTASSVAKRDLEEYSIYEGNPAVKIKNR